MRIRHTDPHELFRRRPAAPRLSLPPLFGAELDAVVAREVRPPHMPPVPVIVRRCVEEIERRGLDIIGKELSTETVIVTVLSYSLCTLISLMYDH